MWQNRADFEACLKDAYEECGMLTDDFDGNALGKVIWAVREEAEITVPVSTEIGLSIIDDMISDAILWCNLFYALLMKRMSDAGMNQPFVASISALFAKITQDSIVVRDLIQTGYDVQARNALRSLEEHIDLALCLFMNPDVCEEFVQTQDEESANRFWYKYIRKVSVAVDRDLKKSLDGASVSEIIEFRRAERKMLSAVHHPSYWACTMLFFSPHSPDNVLNNIFGIRSEFSFRTGRFLYFNLAFLIVLSRKLNPLIDAFVADLSEEDKFQRFVQSGERYFSKMLKFLLVNWKAPVFDESDDFRSFADGLRSQ